MVKNWIERGKKFIYPQRYNSWDNYIKSSHNDEYFSTNYFISYLAMEALEKGKSVEEVCGFINSFDTLVFSKDMVYKTVLLYSKRGPEFYRKAKSPLVNTAEKYIRVIENENKKYQEDLIK